MYRVRHRASIEGVVYPSPEEALRGMARIIRGLPLTPGERRAFEVWFTRATFRTASQRLKCFTHYEIAFSINGARQTYMIEPLPASPQDPVACVNLRDAQRDRGSPPHSSTAG